ncbi:Hypothetical protein NATL1_15741 [Prochlorococcus marinus str. NATL1A]|uniref:Uncharacterized protein n=1 Tax=Prochlorococcus marinus (strain NATL1A) TaxID=167555 RepID=A2C3S1_PROM1|nr:sulfotransferase [Prochlorococcus marinus]ABM76131.1 Hypothetical protein NATL1_15741 [Prochlorococcus marinus str. NATL1A]
MNKKRNKAINHTKRNQVKTFPISFSLYKIKDDLIINTNYLSETPEEEIINQAIKFHLQGKISEAIKYYKHCLIKGFHDEKVFCNYGIILKNLGKTKEAELLQLKAIEIKPNYAEAYSNLGVIYKDKGKLKEAELSLKKAIEIRPNFANAHNNLGIIFNDLGKFKEAELSYLKAIELKPDFAEPYYSLSLLNCSNENKFWQNRLFSKSILNNKSKKEKIDIYFARSNVLHKEKNYIESSHYLNLANRIKLNLRPSNINLRLEKSKRLLLESDKRETNKKEDIKTIKTIFIVGMPRSGSTLLESIISMNPNVDSLGEINFLEESFLEEEHNEQGLNLAELYLEKINVNSTRSTIKTNKYLYNYQYAGIIATCIPNSKIIHCFRNPLDNILSIYRAHFTIGNEYSSSLADCANIYLDQEEIMDIYKKKYRSNIYDLNYDLLVSNPQEEIISLISWLGWEWDDSYLSHHLNPRSISTASSVQVRSPINSKSIGGWKNYRDMLKPVIEILEKHEKYKNL